MTAQPGARNERQSMELKSVSGHRYFLCGSNTPSDLCIYLLGLPQQIDDTHTALRSISCPVVYIVIDDWDNQLSPWSAKGLYRNDADFKGEAPEFLDTLVHELVPAIEKGEGLAPKQRAISGYSLAGLFSVFAFASCDFFKHVASMSGSFWYEGWTEWLGSLERDKHGSFAYLSLGNKERRAKEKILHRVQDATDFTAETLAKWGATVEHHMVPGTHFEHILERVEAGLTALATHATISNAR